jgi:AcrR family transcriptional regulator
MEVFWRHVYDGASLAMLTRAMGIEAPSLYAAFGSKEGLLRAALDRYAQRRSEHMRFATSRARDRSGGP